VLRFHIRCGGCTLTDFSSLNQRRKSQNLTRQIPIELKFCTHLLYGATKMSTKFQLRKIKSWTSAQETSSQMQTPPELMHSHICMHAQLIFLFVLCLEYFSPLLIHAHIKHAKNCTPPQNML